ncbi:hypothetical protein, partial [Pseudomonas syringae group genomosp. 7]|uniref:hypothetical protein n=1 Tax=Pseudomonas syringae group genomosp. 7 TaxID=251699 RepID=UPI00376F6E53
RRLAALHRVEAGQWQLLQDQDTLLLQRFARIHDVLLPAWRQATLADQSAAGAALAGKAATLHFVHRRLDLLHDGACTFLQQLTCG